MACWSRGFSREVVPIKDRSSPSSRPLQHNVVPHLPPPRHLGSQENHAETIAETLMRHCPSQEADDMRKCRRRIPLFVLRKRRILTAATDMPRDHANGENATLVMAPTWLSDPRRTLRSHCPFIRICTVPQVVRTALSPRLVFRDKRMIRPLASRMRVRGNLQEFKTSIGQSAADQPGEVATPFPGNGRRRSKLARHLWLRHGRALVGGEDAAVAASSDIRSNLGKSKSDRARGVVGSTE